jgi:putative transposase
MTEKAYRYRFYPTLEQEQLLRRTLGCVRLVYNKALHVRTEGWYERQERIDYKQTSAMLTIWKQQEDLQFLSEVSSVPLQQGLRNLQKAFTNFWAGRTKYPNFTPANSLESNFARWLRTVYCYRQAGCVGTLVCVVALL